MPQQPYLLADGLTYELPPDRILFQDVQISLKAGDRVALVGANGVGKSTLLKLLAGQLRPSRGTVSRNGSVYYLPQISTLQAQLGEETVLAFLSSQIEEWWVIPELLEAQFQTRLDLSLALQQLSGGELTKLLLAIGFTQQPNVLLLDEPTNHMDYPALEELRQCLQAFHGALVVVSHKPFFLDQVVSTTWELTAGGLTVYGGNFSLYRTQKQAERAAQLRSHEVARKALKRSQAAAMQEQQRAAQSRRVGRQNADSMPKILAGAYQRQAEVTAGKLKTKHEAAIADATRRVTETKVRTHKVTQIHLKESSQKHKNLIDIQGADLWIGNNHNLDHRLLIKNIQFHLSLGDRVAIAGANGCGKSSFAQALLETLEKTTNAPAFLDAGAVFISPSLRAVYLDQTYRWVNRDLTVLQNMQAVNPHLSYQLVRQQLGHFLFFNQAVDQPASVLSGGELARLALAMISIAEIELLILDEPTNNLDIATVDQMVEGVNEYQGALLVIAHDLDFLSRIQITDSYRIHHLNLQRTVHLPSEPEQYYREFQSVEMDAETP